jgi:phosphohistidine phosphatase
MKTLLIVRHAKSSWDSAIISDIDRPLNERGKRDAPAMAQRLVKAGVKIDLFVSSPAKRAGATAEFFAREFGRKGKNEVSVADILFVPELYHASPQVFTEVIAGLDDSYNSAAMFSHNPGITSFVNTLTAVRVDNMPTCGVFAVTSAAGQWNDFQSTGAVFWFFEYPKAG